MHIAEPDIYQSLQFLLHQRNVFEDLQRVRDRSLQQVGNGIALVLYRQSLMVIATPIADFADDINIRQEIHFDPALSFALAGFATAARNVEGEAAGLVTALARFRKHGV